MRPGRPRTQDSIRSRDADAVLTDSDAGACGIARLGAGTPGPHRIAAAAFGAAHHGTADGRPARAEWRVRSRLLLPAGTSTREGSSVSLRPGRSDLVRTGARTRVGEIRSGSTPRSPRQRDRPHRLRRGSGGVAVARRFQHRHGNLDQRSLYSRLRWNLLRPHRSRQRVAPLSERYRSAIADRNRHVPTRRSKCRHGRSLPGRAEHALRLRRRELSRQPALHFKCSDRRAGRIHVRSPPRRF